MLLSIKTTKGKSGNGWKRCEWSRGESAIDMEYLVDFAKETKYSLFLVVLCTIGWIVEYEVDFTKETEYSLSLIFFLMLEYKT